VAKPVALKQLARRLGPQAVDLKEWRRLALKAEQNPQPSRLGQTAAVPRLVRRVQEPKGLGLRALDRRDLVLASKAQVLEKAKDRDKDKAKDKAKDRDKDKDRARERARPHRLGLVLYRLTR
jgi:hypothetical protein